MGLVSRRKTSRGYRETCKLPMGPMAKLQWDAKETIKSNRDDISRVLAQITKLCNYCKYSMFRMYCS